LGCKLNQLESEAFIDAFVRAGFSLYEFSDGIDPSIIIINTCTVTSKADQKARRIIRKSLRDFPDSCVLVTGCYARLDQVLINELEQEHSGRFFVLKDKDKLLDLPLFFTEGTDPVCAVKLWYEDTKPVSKTSDSVFQFSPKRFSSHTRSFLKIQDGCDKHCTYCRIRLARGSSVSLDADVALERLRILEKSHAEAVITGVNICQYREQRAENREQRIESLAELLEYFLSGTRKIALRLSSLEPDFVDESFAKILSHARIRPHFHLSVQSGSGKVLQRMGRCYNSETIGKAVSLLRGVKEDPFLACDIITGFPGETEAEFEETYELCQEIGFAWIHVFPYSKRPGTPAFSYPDTVMESEVTKRVELLTCLAHQGRAEYVKRWIGKDVDVLVEKETIIKEQSGFCHGVSQNYLKLQVQYNGDRPAQGSVLRCRIVGDFTGDLETKSIADAIAKEV
jgi:threonylcarbamoyladenosine tRNA methylthiotransferase MtaB